MSAVILERPRFEDPIDYLNDRLDLAMAVAVHETTIEQEAQGNKATFLGKVAVSGSAEFKTEESKYTSLYDGIRAAYNNDTKGRRMVRSNVKTDTIERTLKAGHVTTVRVEAGCDSSSLSQHGQSMNAVHASTLLFASDIPKMKPRIDAEISNNFRIGSLYEGGMLENNSVLVVSCVSDNMTKSELKDANFFTDTMSISIQLTAADGTELVTEAAFVAGVIEPDSERHDIPAVVSLFERFGIDIAGKSAAEILDTAVLLPNESIPNGIADVVELLDNEIEHVRGDGTEIFFGAARPRQDYVAYGKKCKEREKMFDPKVDAITKELVSLYPTIEDERHASELLDQLSGKHMIEQAAVDYSINPRVFGELAAISIYKARRAIELGDLEEGSRHIEHAKENDQSTSCPGGVSASEKKRNDKECTFISKKCPKCGAKNVLTTVTEISETKKRIEGSCRCVAEYSSK